MMEGIYAYIRNIGYFMIFSAVVRLLAPQGSFRAYINLFLGLMFTLVMLNPVSSFIKTDLPVLRDYILKNSAFAEEELFGSTGEENENIVREEYIKALEGRISEICTSYIEEPQITVETDESFKVTAVYIEGRAVKNAGRLKSLVSRLCGMEEENVFISGEWEE